MKMFFIKVMVLMLATAVVSSCSSERKTPVDIGNREQVLHIGNGGEPSDIDPHGNSGQPDSQIKRAVFEGLVSLRADTLAVIPGVAESWDISEDGMIYTFRLRKDARWSNGDSVTAHDFVWT